MDGDKEVYENMNAEFDSRAESVREEYQGMLNDRLSKLDILDTSSMQSAPSKQNQFNESSNPEEEKGEKLSEKELILKEETKRFWSENQEKMDKKIQAYEARIYVDYDGEKENVMKILRERNEISKEMEERRRKRANERDNGIER